MDREFAIKARDTAVSAISSLNNIINYSDDWDSEDMKILKKSIGIVMGRIETDILGKIFIAHPELDDLA